MALRGMEEIAEQAIGLGFSRLQTEELVTGRASYISKCADIYGTVAIVTRQENSRGDRTETIVTRLVLSGPLLSHGMYEFFFSFYYKLQAYM